MWITWKHQDTDFTQPLSFDDKILIFYERIWGWQLHVAELCLNGGKTLERDAEVQQIPHSAFAAMQIMLSYFEMIAKYEDGFIADRQSKKYFMAGVKMVFPNLASQDNTAVDSLLKTFYERARCGLYHIGQTKAGIVLTKTQQQALQFDPSRKLLVIDPHQLSVKLKDHLDEYRGRLLKPENTRLRKNFENRFDKDNAA